MSKYQTIIGRSEEVDIVGLAMHVPAKIDTGAYRSSIHASDIKVKSVEGRKILSFKVLGHPCSPIKRDIETFDFDTVTVRSSNGQEEERYEVKLKIKLGTKGFLTSFSLADRRNNIFPMLIGRKALKTRFVVDVNRTGVNKARLLREFGVKRPRDEEDLED